MTTAKPPKRRINGVLLLDKPKGKSSNTALQISKRLFQAEKAGHTGILDPLATGLLPVCFGEATKYAQYLLDSDKAYIADLQLGIETTTGDVEGEESSRSDARITARRFFALHITGGGFNAQLQIGNISFVGVEQVLRVFGGFAKTHGQQACGQRVEYARVAGFFGLKQAFTDL